MTNNFLTKDRSVIKKINTIYFLLIIFLGIYFGKERVVFNDGAMALYDISSMHLPYFALDRITTTFNYLLPFFAILMGMSLKSVVYSLAVNYLLLPVFVFLFLRYKQTSVKYELSFLISFSIFNWLTYYFPIHDYWTGYYLIFAFYRIADDDLLDISIIRKRQLMYLFILMILFTHLSTVISLGSLLLYLFIDKRIFLKEVRNLFFFIFFILILKILVVNTPYQNSVIDLKNLDIHEFMHSKTMKELLSSMCNTNSNFSVLLVVFFSFLFSYKKTRIIVFFVFQAIGMLIVIYFLFKNYGYNIYTEGYFKSLSIVSVIIFTNTLLMVIKKERYLIPGLFFNYLFSIIILYNGGVVFQKQYNFVNENCKRFQNNIFLKSEKDYCPLECIVIPRQSILINQLENNRNTCIFANVGNEPFVIKLNQKWIHDNKIKPVKYFNFPEEMKYLNADSMHIPMDSFSILFRKNKCDDLIRRLDQ